jgi:hypothetical protein
MTEENFRHVKILPWVGDNYGKKNPAFRQRTLILGGSHYDKGFENFHDPEKQPEWANNTNEIVWCYLDENIRDTWKKTYSTFINSVYDQPSNQDQRRDFFDSVIFYNYLQEIAGANAYEAGKSNYRDRKHFDAFKEVLAKYRPEVVIAWGKKVWEGLPNDWGYGPAVIRKGVSVGTGTSKDIYDYPFEGGTISLIGVNHPSIGYSPDFHHQIFKQLDLIA